MLTKKLLQEIIISLLVLLFLYTALSKFLDFKNFRYEINNQPFPNELTALIIWIIPLTELAIVIAILFKGSRQLGMLGSLILMSLFTLYTVLVLLQVFPYVPCSCGGVIKELTWAQHLLFNLFFVTISFIGLQLEKQSNTSCQPNEQTV